MAGGEEELVSLQLMTATSSCFFWAREETGASGDPVRERGVASIKFPMVGAKRRNEKAISAGVKTMALTQEQLQKVIDAGDRWSDRWIRWSLANS